MVVDGSYDIEVSMPEGKRTIHLVLKSQGKTISGSIDGPFGKYSFSEGSINNNEIAWRVILKHQAEEKGRASVKKQETSFFRKLGRFFGVVYSAPPMGTLPERESEKSKTEMPIDFKATVSGDEISGKMKFGPYGIGDFKGIRTGKQSHIKEK
jgi:hypothetical protein